MTIRDIAIDMVNFTLSNVNDAISFKPQLCYEVNKDQYNELKEKYIQFTGTSIRKNKSKLFFLPTNISDELQQLNNSIPEDAKRIPEDGYTYYKNRLITELDFENVKRVEKACVYIAYSALNQAINIETEPDVSVNDYDLDGLEPSESLKFSLKRGDILGFRELGHLICITPWHFHRVFKVIIGLTIREYGQLCTEFFKKNEDIIEKVKWKIGSLRSEGNVYSCLTDGNFMSDEVISYEPTDNVVLLPEYFIDPNKSKELRKNQKDLKTLSDGKCLARVEARKRRNSAMSLRIRRASVATISSNWSIQEALNYSHTPPVDAADTFSFNHNAINPDGFSLSPRDRKFKNNVGKITKTRRDNYRRNFSDSLLEHSIGCDYQRPEYSICESDDKSVPFLFTNPQIDFKFHIFDDDTSVPVHYDGLLDPYIPPVPIVSTTLLPEASLSTSLSTVANSSQDLVYNLGMDGGASIPQHSRSEILPSSSPDYDWEYYHEKSPLQCRMDSSSIHIPNQSGIQKHDFFPNSAIDIDTGASYTSTAIEPYFSSSFPPQGIEMESFFQVCPVNNVEPLMLPGAGSLPREGNDFYQF